MNFNLILALFIGFVLGSSITTIIKNRKINELEFVVELMALAQTNGKTKDGYSVKFVNIEQGEKQDDYNE